MRMFWRRKPPSSDTVSKEYALGMRKMEAWYQDFVVWVYAYISLLEKHVEQLEQTEKNSCIQCKNRDPKN